MNFDLGPDQRDAARPAEREGEVLRMQLDVLLGLGEAPRRVDRGGRGRREAGDLARHWRSAGKRITSRIDGWRVRSITSRSIPTPTPAVGGRP